MGLADQNTIKKYLANKEAIALPERYHRIFEFRNGLLGEKCHTLRETGEKFEVSRERIRQMEAKVLDRIESLGEPVSP